MTIGASPTMFYKKLMLLLFVSTLVFVVGMHMNRGKNLVEPGMIIILNGPSSVGKSSIIKAFQAKLSTPWLSAGIDHLYVGVVPAEWLDDAPEHAELMTVEKTADAKGPLVRAVFGPMGERVIKGMHRAIAAYAHAGNKVIVDYIKYEPHWLADLHDALRGLKVIWVGVTAPLETIEVREKARGTSPQGHARTHYETVHQGMKYDLVLDTSQLTPEVCADKIVALLNR